MPPKQLKQRANKYEADLVECVVDFLNLIFGSGLEADVFWRDILAKQVHADFQFSLMTVRRTDLIFGGLLFAVMHHCRINLRVDITLMQMEPFKHPKPFRKDHFLGLLPKVKTFSCRALTVKQLADAYQSYREKELYDLAIEACNIKMKLDEVLAGRDHYTEDAMALADLAEISFQKGEIDAAIEKALQSITNCQQFHVETVKPLCLLMRAYLSKKNIPKSLEFFDRAMKILNFQLGNNHPLHVTVYNVLGRYYLENAIYSEALVIYEKALKTCEKMLGYTHPTTGEVLFDLAKLKLLMKEKMEATHLFEKALHIFEASKGPDSDESAICCRRLCELKQFAGKEIRNFYLYE